MKNILFLKAENLNKEIIQLIIERYPNGYGYDNIVSVQNPTGKVVKAIMVEDIENQIFVEVSLKLEEIIDKNINKDIFPIDNNFDLYFDEFT